MDTYKRSLQTSAARFLELKLEHERAREDRDRAEERFTVVGNQLRDVEADLCKSVGANIQKRLFAVDAGRFVLVRFHNSTHSFAEVLETEPTS